MSKQVWALIIIAVTSVTLLGAYVYGLFDAGESEEGEPVAISQLTGEEVSQEEAERPILSVIIENSQPARPQTGLDSAGIVFEAVAEGGVTRTLAFYQADMPEQVGPIRSLRPYLLDWAMGFDASIVHVGGSGEALQLSEDRNAKSLDQFRYSEPYYRSEDRAAPHNMYADTQDLRDLQVELGHSTSQFADIPRSSDSPAEVVAAEIITIDYSTPAFEAEFHHQEADNTYVRHLAGEPHIDAAQDEPIAVSNVVVVYANTTDGAVEATGSGQAVVFKDGGAIDTQWQKPSHEERIKLVNNSGEEVPLNRGDSWFVVVSDEQAVTY